MEFIYQEETKERLDKFLQAQLPDITRSQLKKMILAGLIMVNGQLSSVHHWLKTGDKVLYDNHQKPAKADFNFEPKIIEQNENYLIIDKPAGLLVHPTERGEINTLADWLVKKIPAIKKIGEEPMRPGIVHRLDKDVSGLMVVALNQNYFDLLKKQFQERTVQKEYLALVHGALLEEEGEINTPLERNKETGLMRAQTMHAPGKKAITLYKVEQKFINSTLIKVHIKTGRTHQIRAHLYSIGHSIVGDTLYRTKNLRKKKKAINDVRIFLHAYYLKFKDHENHWQEYTSPLPTTLKNFLTTVK